jgi:hypothetical protein
MITKCAVKSPYHFKTGDSHIGTNRKSREGGTPVQNGQHEYLPVEKHLCP